MLGGPIGVYDVKDYPFLTAEIDALRQRLADRQPTLGICLGAQLMAAALGRGFIWAITDRRSAGSRSCRRRSRPPQNGLRRSYPWSGRFSLARGHIRSARRRPGSLARTSRYENQAFAWGDYALALQFHPEATEVGLERWYVGHSCELRANGISVSELRSASHAHAAILERAAAEFWRLWLDHIL